MQKASRILGLLGAVLFLLGIYLMFLYPPTDDKRAIAVIIVVGGPAILMVSRWLSLVDYHDKLNH